MSSIPINPFKDIRERANLSQYELARRAKVSKHAVLRLEQGMFTNPVPTLLNYFTANFNVSRISLTTAYEQFQISTRVNTGRALTNNEPMTEALASYTPETHGHPLTYLREHAKPPFNPTSLAKSLCVAQHIVVYFEKRAVHQHTVPTELLAALTDCGYTPDDLSLFTHCYEEYRNYLVKGQNLRYQVPKQINLPVGAPSHAAE